MNPILARFQDEPSLIGARSRAWFESCVMEAGVLAEREGLVTPLSALAGEDFWPEADHPMTRFRPYVVRDGMLLIPVKGALLNGFPYQLGQWATGYEYIWQAMRRGVADSNVRGISLLIDSPGGMVAGNFDLVDKMFALRGTKPIRAFAHESAYSAAYNIASAADDITVSRTGGVGSIGVVTVHVDMSQALEADGIRVTFIYAGSHKVDGNPYEPLPEAVKERIQERIDALYDDFVSSVARNRDMEEQAVRDTEAQTFMASEALQNGLADAIGTLEDSLAAFASSLNPEETGDDEMTDQALETARASAHADGQREGATAERARINAILASEPGKARPKAAMSAALKTDMTVEQATAFLADLPEEKAEVAADATAGAPKGMFAAAMAAGNPELGAGGGEGEPEMSVSERILANAGYARRRA